MISAVLFAGILSVNTARAIAIAPRERPTWASLELPQQVSPGSTGGYDDLRITDDRDEETPYVLDPECAEQPTHQAIVSDVGFVPGRYTEALLDAGNSGTLYSNVSIDSPRNTYFTRVDVAISDDRATWREVRKSALIYRVADSDDPGNQTISFSPARARWIRVRVLDGHGLFQIDGATVVPIEARPSQNVKELDAHMTSGTSEQDQKSLLTLDLGTKDTPVAWIRFRTTQSEFSRDVSIQTSNGGDEWDYAGSGHIQRFAHGTPEMEVPVQASARYVRVEVSNESDAPLPKLDISAYGPRRVLVFVARPGRSYALTQVAYAQAPRYDLNDLLEHDNPRIFVVARLTAITTERLPRPTPTVPQPLILTLAFAVVIVSLGAVTLGTLRPGRVN